MINVIEPGFYSTIQDMGRIGFEEYGVPSSGVMDQYSAKLANLLIGNSTNRAVMEITMVGPKIEFRSNVIFSLSGADMSPKINDSPIRMNSVIAANSGDILSFGKLNFGFRTYMAISGGFQTQEVMKSRSMFRRVTSRFMLKKGDSIKVLNYDPFENQKNASIKVNEDHFKNSELEVYPGPEFEFISEAVKTTLLETDFTVAKEHNRMGYQIEELVPNELEQIITSLVMPGTVQLTPGGRLIILMRDCQTTGGYPRVFQLSENAINVLSQKKTGSRVSFKLLKYASENSN